MPSPPAKAATPLRRSLKLRRRPPFVAPIPPGRSGSTKNPPRERRRLSRARNGLDRIWGIRIQAGVFFPSGQRRGFAANAPPPGAERGRTGWQRERQSCARRRPRRASGADSPATGTRSNTATAHGSGAICGRPSMPICAASMPCWTRWVSTARAVSNTKDAVPSRVTAMP